MLYHLSREVRAQVNQKPKTSNDNKNNNCTHFGIHYLNAVHWVDEYVGFHAGYHVMNHTKLRDSSSGWCNLKSAKTTFGAPPVR